MLINNIVQQGDRKKIHSVSTYTSPLSAISNGSPIYFNHGFESLSINRGFVCTVYLVNVEANEGYEPGEIVTPSAGISIGLSELEFVVRPASNGVFVVEKNKGKSEKIKPEKWNLFISAILL